MAERGTPVGARRRGRASVRQPGAGPTMSLCVRARRRLCRLSHTLPERPSCPGRNPGWPKRRRLTLVPLRRRNPALQQLKRRSRWRPRLDVPNAIRRQKALTLKHRQERNSTGNRGPRRMALKSAIVLGILAVPALGTWLLNPPPVAIQGWSRALAPPSLVPSRNAPNSVATAALSRPEEAAQAASGPLESGGASTGTSPDGLRSAAPAGRRPRRRCRFAHVADNPGARHDRTRKPGGACRSREMPDALSTPVAPKAPPSPANRSPRAAAAADAGQPP